METEIFKKIQEYFDPVKIKKKEKLILIFSFIFAAVFLWFLNILKEDHIAIIKHRFEYSNFPEEKVLVNELPEYLNLRVKAKGSKIFQHNFSSTLRPVRIDYQSLKKNQPDLNNDNRTFILSQAIRNDLKLEDFEVLSISPDSLFFHFAEEKSKKVEVRTNIDYRLEKQFMLNGKIISDPDSIIITGPDVNIDTINFVSTEYYEIKKLRKAFNRNLSIVKPHDKVILSHDKVNVNIAVEKFTERELNIPIEAENLPDSLSLRTFPGNLKLKFHVVLSEYEKYEATHFRAVVDYNSIEQNLNNKLRVKIVKSPDNIYLVSYSPTNVEYIIEK